MLPVSRANMVKTQIRARGVKDTSVLKAMIEIPRHEFVPWDMQDRAYDDCALPIGNDQTISQPYVVAFMTELLQLKPGHKVLEIGTGSGYQTAVLRHLTSEVFSIEIVGAFHEEVRARLAGFGLSADRLRLGDGYHGWPEHAPFDAIIVTAAPDHVPKPLVDQLKPGGRMVLPVGPVNAPQELQVIEKDAAGKLKITDALTVRFVPLTREKAS